MEVAGLRVIDSKTSPKVGFFCGRAEEPALSEAASAREFPFPCPRIAQARAIPLTPEKKNVSDCTGRGMNDPLRVIATNRLYTSETAWKRFLCRARDLRMISPSASLRKAQPQTLHKAGQSGDGAAGKQLVGGGAAVARGRRHLVRLWPRAGRTSASSETTEQGHTLQEEKRREPQAEGAAATGTPMALRHRRSVEVR